MKILMDKPIDIIYELYLKELQEFYDGMNMEEVVKQCISMHHNSIKEFKDKIACENEFQQHYLT